MTGFAVYLVLLIYYLCPHHTHHKSNYVWATLKDKQTDLDYRRFLNFRFLTVYLSKSSCFVKCLNSSFQSILVTTCLLFATNLL